MATALSGVVPLFLEIAPGADPASDGDDWVWVDVTKDVRQSRGVVIADGRDDEAQQVDAGSIEFDINNGPSNVVDTLDEVGCYTPRNPVGPYYGRLKRAGTPVRAGTYSAEDAFGRTSASGYGTADRGGAWAMSANGVSSVGSGVASRSVASASQSLVDVLIAGGGIDTDGRVTLSVPNVATGGNLSAGVHVRYTANTDLYAFYMTFRTDLGVSLGINRISVAAGNAVIADTGAIAATTYSAGQRWTLRFQADGQRLRAKVWKEADQEPDAWALSVDDTANPGGGGVGFYYARAAANSNAAPQFNMDDFSVKTVEGVGTVTELPPRWDLSGNDAWVPITASGSIRQQEQSKGQLASPLAAQLPAYNPTGLWMGEDGSAAESLSAGDGRSAAGVVSNVEFAAADDLAGATTTFKLIDATSIFRCRAGSRNGGTGFSAMIIAKCDSAPAAETELVKWTATGRVVTWRVTIGPVSTQLTVYGYDSTGATVVTSTHSGYALTEWVAYQLETAVVGANTEWALTAHTVGTVSFGGESGSYASTVVSSVTGVSGEGNATFGIGYSSLYLGQNTLPFVTLSFARVSSGYDGELAAARIARVFDQASITCLIEPGDTAACGPQRPGTALEVARLAADVDNGVLHERGAGMGYRPGSARYDPAVALELDRSDGHLAEAPLPTDDDQRLFNDVEVSRTNGGTARAIDQDSIDELGSRKAPPATIDSQGDSVLKHHAGWRVWLGTYDDLRWPRIKIDLRRNYDLAAAWRARGFAPRMTVANEMEQIQGFSPDVIVEGVTQTIKIDEWTAEMNTTPARPWILNTLDDTDFRLGIESCTLDPAGAGLTTTATAIVVIPPAEQPFPTASGEYPLRIRIGGEVITISGAAAYAAGKQTLTASARSVNGVIKTHAAGDTVELLDDIVLAL